MSGANGARMGAVFIVTLVVNLATAAPTVVEGDGAELQTVAVLGGVAHPTGYPTWTMCARLFATVWPGEPARRVTASSAVAGAAVPVVAMRVLAGLGAGPGAALAGAVAIAAGVTARWASIYPEVYALALLLFLIALDRTLRVARRPTLDGVLGAATLLSLAVTGHFAFAPAAAVLGTVLLVRGERAPGPFLRRAGVIAVGVLCGLTPYLYAAWADASGAPMNYLRLVVDPSTGMFGLTPERFDSPLERIGWLVTGAETRTFPYYLHPRFLALNVWDALGQEFLFDAGPVALALAPLGAATLWRRDSTICAALLGIVASSVAFASALADGRVLLLFLLPCTAVLAVLTGLGAERVASTITRRPAATAALAVAIALTASILPHAIRLHAREHPIGPRGWRHAVEAGPPIETLWPRLDHAWQPRRTGERALELMPQGALVIARWRELTTLYYLRDVEGRRRDLTLDPVYRGHEARYARWQATHEPRERPFVMLGWSPEVAPYLGRLDSLAVTDRLTMYIQREPMRGLPESP